MAAKYAKEVADDAGSIIRIRLVNSVFGEGRATRSTDVAIVNMSGKTLRLGNPSCSCTSGGFSELPPEVIEPGELVMYRVESHGVATGCTNCEVTYHDDAGNSYSWFTSNPYVGSNTSGATSGNLSVRMSIGNNGNARVFIR